MRYEFLEHGSQLFFVDCLLLSSKGDLTFDRLTCGAAWLGEHLRPQMALYSRAHIFVATVKIPRELGQGLGSHLLGDREGPIEFELFVDTQEKVNAFQPILDDFPPQIPEGRV